MTDKQPNREEENEQLELLDEGEGPAFESQQEHLDALAAAQAKDERAKRVERLGRIVDNKLKSALLRAKVADAALDDAFDLLRGKISDAKIVDGDFQVSAFDLADVPMDTVAEHFLAKRPHFIDTTLGQPPAPETVETERVQTLVLPSGERVQTTPARMRRLDELPSADLYDAAGDMPPPGTFYDPREAPEDRGPLSDEDKYGLTPGELYDYRPTPTPAKRGADKPLNKGEGVSKRLDDLYDQAGPLKDL